MSSGTKTINLTFQVTAARMFAGMEDWENLGAKALPSMINSGTVLSGDGKTAGSVVQFNFTSAMPFSYAQERLDYVDYTKLVFGATVVKGGFLGTEFKSIAFQYTFKAAGNSGSAVTLVTNYTVLPGVTITQDNIDAAVKSATTMMRAAEAYLVANPGAYA